MMVHAMSSCSSCCAHYCAGRGESVWTGLMSSFPPARTIMKTETCARPHARTSDFIAISASLLCTHVHCRHMSSCWTGRWHLRAACTTHLASAVALEMHGFMHCGAHGCNYLDVVYASLLIVILITATTQSLIYTRTCKTDGCRQPVHHICQA